MYYKIVSNADKYCVYNHCKSMCDFFLLFYFHRRDLELCSTIRKSTYWILVISRLSTQVLTHTNNWYLPNCLLLPNYCWIKLDRRPSTRVLTYTMYLYLPNCLLLPNYCWINLDPPPPPPPPKKEKNLKQSPWTPFDFYFPLTSPWWVLSVLV